MISVPQFDIQPFWFGAAVPGAPVLDSEMVQNSDVVPHWPTLAHYGQYDILLNTILDR